MQPDKGAYNFNNNFSVFRFNAFYIKSVFLPEKEPQSAVGVYVSDAVTVFYLAYFLRRNADAVVGDIQIYIVPFSAAGDGNRSAAAAFFADSVMNGIFNKRLQNKLGNLAFHNVFGNVNIKPDCVIKLEVFYFNIVSDVHQLRCQLNGAVAVMEA